MLPAAAPTTPGQAAVWRTGLLLHRAEGQLVSPGAEDPSGALPLLDTDLAEELRADGVRVLPLPDRRSSSEVAG